MFTLSVILKSVRKRQESSISTKERLTISCLAVADWPTGKPGYFPVGPCFMKLFGPPAVHANLIHL